jgi:ABC-type Fe3+/spermidine/putrescine transport system ATPase subunit
MNVLDDQASAAGSAGVAVRLEQVSKRFERVLAVDRCSLDIAAGQFVTIVGPSGSGKTTLLNLIAGFLSPDHGEIFFGGAPITGVAPHKRGIGMVFQSYALFPHMSVFDNVAFPLRMRSRSDAAGRAERVQQVLEMARLGELVARRPSELSGGQRQRVAMARALVSRPPLLLLDEPLSALDQGLREELQVEIKSLHRRVGSTFICVTHDQHEALAMSDLVVVMRGGRIEQIAEPQTLYQRPQTAFVARFLGGANVLAGRTVGAAGAEAPLGVALGDGEHVVARTTRSIAADSAVEVVFRPEICTLEREARAHGPEGPLNHVRVQVIESAFLGDAVKVMVQHRSQTLLVKLPPAAAAAVCPGETLSLCWPVAQTLLMATDTVSPSA